MFFCSNYFVRLNLTAHRLLRREPECISMCLLVLNQGSPLTKWKSFCYRWSLNQKLTHLLGKRTLWTFAYYRRLKTSGWELSPQFCFKLSAPKKCKTNSTDESQLFFWQAVCEFPLTAKPVKFSITVAVFLLFEFLDCGLHSTEIVRRNVKTSVGH